MRTKLHYLIIGLLLGVFTLPVMATGQFMVGPYLRDITDNSVTLVWENPTPSGRGFVLRDFTGQLSIFG